MSFVPSLTVLLSFDPYQPPPATFYIPPPILIHLCPSAGPTLPSPSNTTAPAKGPLPSPTLTNLVLSLRTLGQLNYPASLHRWALCVGHSHSSASPMLALPQLRHCQRNTPLHATKPNQRSPTTVPSSIIKSSVSARKHRSIAPLNQSPSAFEPIHVHDSPLSVTYFHSHRNSPQLP